MQNSMSALAIGGVETSSKKVAVAPSGVRLAAPKVVVGTVGVGNLSGGRKGSGPPPPGFSDVRVDRQSALGNPFPMGDDGHDEHFRDAVCDACAELFEAPLQAEVQPIAAAHGLRVDSRFSEHPAMRNRDAALRELEDRLRAGESLRLMCWCAPKRCHGDGIAQLLVRILHHPCRHPRLSVSLPLYYHQVRRVEGAEIVSRRPSEVRPRVPPGDQSGSGPLKVPVDQAGGGRGGSGGRGRGRGRSRLQNSYAN